MAILLEKNCDQMEKLFGYLSTDHRRLDALLDRAENTPLDIDSYKEFRKGLLRHIGIEEKIIFPALTRLRDGLPPDAATKLKLDHGALVALLVPTPTPAIIGVIRSILEMHNALEEGEEGVYRQIDRLAGDELEELISKIKSAPEVPVLAFNDRPGIMEVTRRAVERAGYKNLSSKLVS